MTKQDRLHTLFQDGCPEPRGSAEFRARVLERTHTERHRQPRPALMSRVVDLMLSPLPLLMGLIVLLIVFWPDLYRLLSTEIGGWEWLSGLHIPDKAMMIILTCVTSSSLVMWCIHGISENTRSIDIKQIHLQLEEKRS